MIARWKIVLVIILALGVASAGIVHFILPVEQDLGDPYHNYCLYLGGRLIQERTQAGNITTLCAFTTGVVCEVHELYDGDCSSLDVQVHFCEDAERRLDVCHEVYSPVCATDARDRKETYPNGCFACLNSRVEYWQPGECR